MVDTAVTSIGSTVLGGSGALLSGGVILAILYACWDKVKVYLNKIYSLFFVRIETDSDLNAALISWVLTNAKSSKLTIHNFTGITDFVKPINKNQIIAYEIPSREPTIFWYKKRPFIFSNDGHITFLRFTFNVKKLMKEIVDFYNASLGDNDKIDRFFIRKFHGSLQPRNEKNNSGKKDGNIDYGSVPAELKRESSYKHLQKSLTPIGWNKNDIGQVKKPEPLSHLALSDKCMEAIKEIKRWRESEEWYKEKQIPHKKGILFYGSPGCGKSSVAKALAMELNMPIMIFDLSNMSNEDFSNNWDNVKNNTPCMVLLEDIDSVFDGRKNVIHEEGGLSFDCLLNCLDGVEAADGLLIVATTNNIDKIDAALGKPNGDDISTRPGRIDRALELLPPDCNGRCKIANRILGDFPNEIEKTVEAGSHDTGAQFQERCSRLALKLFWENKEKS